MKLVVINGNYKAKGNTIDLLNQFLQAFPLSIDLEMIHLKDLSIAYCPGCLACERTGACVLKDDMDKVTEAMERADLVVVISPIYFNSVTALCKTMIDRLQVQYENRYVRKTIPKDTGKLGVFLSTAGAYEKNRSFDGARKVMDLFFKGAGIHRYHMFIAEAYDQKEKPIDDSALSSFIKEILKTLKEENSMSKKLVPVGLSNRHIHLSQKDIDVLFGEGYELTKFKDLSQPGQFAANEKVEVVGPKGSMKVRILGPARKESQLEVSVTDGFALGLIVPVRNSGDLGGSPGITLKGPEGEVDLDAGVIAAARHIHMHTSDAEKFGLKDKDLVSVKVDGPRGLVFNNVLVRVHDTFALDFHLDIDEGNAAGLKNGDLVEIV